MRKEHSKYKKTMSSRVATSVVNLCTAYKYLLHRKLNSECLEKKPTRMLEMKD